MIIIDKLCYRSKLRYVSAAEKLLYAVSSLMICVLTRSYAAALIVFIANGILTVGKGKIPLSCYVRLLMIPIVFLIVRSCFFKSIESSYGCICRAGRGNIYNGKP